MIDGLVGSRATEDTPIPPLLSLGPFVLHLPMPDGAGKPSLRLLMLVRKLRYGLAREKMSALLRGDGFAPLTLQAGVIGAKVAWEMAIMINAVRAESRKTEPSGFFMLFPRPLSGI